jgi:hypothetical protein
MARKSISRRSETLKVQSFRLGFNRAHVRFSLRLNNQRWGGHSARAAGQITKQVGSRREDESLVDNERQGHRLCLVTGC